MQVLAKDFIESPDIYLDKVGVESVIIIKDGQEIAVLAKPSSTPLTDSLLGILKGAGIKNANDIKDMRLNA